MKKIMNIAIGYAVLGMVAGVFYREFTKFNSFTGETTLSVVHTHLFVLGMIMVLIIGIFAFQTNLLDVKKFNIFFLLYNLGVVMASIMLTVRGVTTVATANISTGLDASISGISGISHIILAIGLIGLLFCIKKVVVKL